VYLVTARHLVSPGARTASGQLHDFEHWLDEAIEAGVDAIQLREPDLDPAVLLPLASRLVARLRGTATRLLVNERADVAIAAWADGVHLRSTGPAVDRVRALCGPKWIVGRSVHRTSEAAAHRSADYLLFGTVFSSESKPAGAGAAGLDSLRSAVGVAGTTPVVAIGGVTPERTRACLAAGAAGVAAIGAFLPHGTRPGALGPADAVRAFRAAIDEGSPQG
jgi:thiamine-phosphate pyrophosphorylase